MALTLEQIGADRFLLEQDIELHGLEPEQFKDAAGAAAGSLIGVTITVEDVQEATALIEAEYRDIWAGMQAR